MPGTKIPVHKLEQGPRTCLELKRCLCFRERYRDLIDAADTVTEMKTCAGQVSKDIVKSL